MLLGRGRLSGWGVTVLVVDVTEADVARIPRRNVRVSRAEFAAVWRTAERLGGDDWYAAGVAFTCRWLAWATVRPASGPWHPARAPVTGRTNLAFEELIEVEYLEAEKLDMRRPRPEWLLGRPGWSEGICATLRWAWCRTGPAPLRVEEAATG
ncbi:MAG: hypothetical protein LC700_00050 [Actinobacteria bacterium]|nr:hypothetical protein [Actinomycetota bacterium]